MKTFIGCLFLLVMTLSGVVQSDSAVSKIVGAGVECTGCIVFPSTVEIRCQAPESCTRLMAPDWTNENRFYGSDGSNCRVSTDKGDTWANCPSNPSGIAYLNYAVTMNGTILAAANDGGGTVLRIRRSTNGAVSWSTIYDGTPVDGEAVTKNGHLRCSRDEDTCTFIYLSTAGPTEVVYLIGTNDGQNWAKTQTGVQVSNVGSGSLTLTNDGIFGFSNLNASGGLPTNRALIYDGGTELWTFSTPWPTTAGGICNWSFIYPNGARRAICHDTTLGTTYNVRDENGIIQTTFSLPDVPSDNGGNQVGQAISIRNTGIWMLRTDTAGRTGIWISTDSGNSFLKITQTDPPGQGIGTQGSIFEGIDGCIYTSYLTVAAVSTVLRIC